MKVFLQMIKRRVPATILVGAVYLITLMISIGMVNHNSMVNQYIEPYIFGSDLVDLLFPLLATAPFSYLTYYFSSESLNNLISIRTDSRGYKKKIIGSAIVMCFMMVFIVNFLAVIYSARIAKLNSYNHTDDYSLFILGTMQMNKPILFGFIWSLYKALVGCLMCILGQVLALYSKNFFITMLGPFFFVIFENFITATFQLQRFSFTTAFILNRLDPSVMSITNIIIGISSFIIMTLIIYKILREKYENKN